MLRLTAFLVLLFSPLAIADDLETEVRRFTGVWALIEEHAADPVPPPTAFYQGAIPGMLRRLDPHSVFFDPGQFDQLKKLQTSTRKGFGSIVSVLPGRVIILQAMPGTPSAKSGIAPGDEIVSINGYRLEQLDMEQLAGLLGESRQREAQLEVRRAGHPGVLQFKLTPEEMQSPSVERAFFVNPGIGYLRVASFDEKTGAQIREAMEKLGGRNLKGLVLDLRNNPGGLLPAALETAALFLKPGMTLLSVRGRAATARTEKTPPDNQPYDCRVAVLVNSKSASAAEIVAGALQDHDRAVIVGETSFGKGLVETVFPLSEDTGLALTTALYYTPSGRSIQKPLDSSQFALAGKAAESSTGQAFQTDSGRKVRGGGGIQPDYEVFPEPATRLRAFLDGSGSFTGFATEYTQKHPGIKEDFQVTATLLDQFQHYLSQRNIRPGVAEWSQERDFIRNRLKTEVFNLALGVEKGDEVEAERDPQIRKAVELLTGSLQ